MSSFLPKGRANLPRELAKFGRNLVYSEGTKTEPYYVENIKRCIGRKYQCDPNKIEIIPVNKEKKSYSTISLVDYAIDDVKKRSKKEQIDNVWIFFDKDSFKKADFDNAHKKIIALNNSTDTNIYDFKYEIETGIWHSCATNEAFELWLCLYFDNVVSSLSRDEYIEKLNNNKKLKESGFEYSKNLRNIHDALTLYGGDIKKAIKFSKKLCIENKTSNPSCYVYEFAEFFLPYFEINSNN